MINPKRPPCWPCKLPSPCRRAHSPQPQPVATAPCFPPSHFGVTLALLASGARTRDRILRGEKETERPERWLARACWTPRSRRVHGSIMRPLTDDETKVLFEKLANYIGKNIEQLINRPDEKCCFRLHKDRVYYVRCKSRSLLVVVSMCQNIRPACV